METGAMHMLGHVCSQATYAKILSSCLPLVHPNTLARSRVRERQVLVDKDPLVTTNHLETLSEHELVAKANEAIAKMTEASDLDQRIKDVRAVGEKKLNNGGIVFKLDSDKVVQWVGKEKAVFSASLRGTSMVRDRAVLVIVECIPVLHNPDALTENRRIK